MLGFTLDITERKQLELEQQRIAAAERRGREASERNALAMDQFLTSVTHELRSPLSAILNWAQLLQFAQEEAEVGRASETIQRNARQLSLLVDDLLDTGAIVSGKLAIRPSEVALERVVVQVVADLQPEARRKGLGLSVLHLDPAIVHGDMARLTQIVWNLVTNAIKYTDQGQIDLSLQAEHGEASLRVTDTGRGIESHRIAELFDRFAQVRSENSSRVNGLGLGLWLVKNLVERHDGSIEATSAGLGRGSTFVVRLPLAGSAGSFLVK